MTMAAMPMQLTAACRPTGVPCVYKTQPPAGQHKLQSSSTAAMALSHASM